MIFDKKKDLDNLLIKMKIAFLLLFNGTWNFSTCNYWWNWVLLSNLIDWKWWNRILKDIPSGYLHTFVELLTQHQSLKSCEFNFYAIVYASQSMLKVLIANCWISPVDMHVTLSITLYLWYSYEIEWHGNKTHFT